MLGEKSAEGRGNGSLGYQCVKRMSPERHIRCYKFLVKPMAKLFYQLSRKGCVSVLLEFLEGIDLAHRGEERLK